MCGILGFWFPSEVNNKKFLNIFNSMSEKLEHRGPDNNGLWHDKDFGIYFSHQRLSIIDLSSNGNQPMHSQSGRYVITFNGEIYNHLELRKDLEKENNLKRKWKGNSDTETILLCIEAYGLEKAVDKFVGMFAFALWDRKDKNLYLVRDRFGEKPLFWGFLKNKSFLSYNDLFINEMPALFFSSELSVISKMKDINVEIDPVSQAAFLNYGYLPEPLSIYKNIYKLPPNTIFKFEPGRNGYFVNKKPQIVKYWDYKNFIKQKYSSKEEVFYQLDSALDRAVKDQSISDVPIGVFLSGGIDSSLITSIFQEQNSKPIKSFSIGFNESGCGEKFFDESDYSKKIAKYLGTDHTQIQLNSKDILNIIPSIFDIYSEPFADPSLLPTYLLSKITRDAGVKVALSGDGGDELFGGYNRHWIAPRLFFCFRYFPKKIREIIASSPSNIFISKNGLHMDKYQKLIRAIGEADSIGSIYESLLTQWPSYNQFSKLPNIPDLEFYDTNSPLESLLINDLLFYLPSDILTKVDRASMAVSLETRAPFLDHRLAAIALKIPNNMKINSNFSKISSKWVLRKILEKKIPFEYINKKKVGFAVPIAKWLQGPLKSWADDLLNDKTDSNFIDRNKVKNIWLEHLDSKFDHSNRLWSILMWKLWLKSNL